MPYTEKETERISTLRSLPYTEEESERKRVVYLKKVIREKKKNKVKVEINRASFTS